MTPLIDQIQSEIIDRASEHTHENIYDEYSSANFEEGTLFAVNLLMPIVKKLIEMLTRERLSVISDLYHEDSVDEMFFKFISELDKELLALLKEQAK